jgi:hypothetical protein
MAKLNLNDDPKQWFATLFESSVLNHFKAKPHGIINIFFSKVSILSHEIGVGILSNWAALIIGL